MYKTNIKTNFSNISNEFTVDDMLELTKEAMDGNNVTTQKQLAEKYNIDDNEYYSKIGDIKRLLRMIVQTGVDSKLNKNIRKL